MPAHHIIATALSETYSTQELKTSRRALLDAAMAPDALTGEQLEGVSFDFRPRTIDEITQAVENVSAALDKLDSGSNPNTSVRGRFINFGSRRIE